MQYALGIRLPVLTLADGSTHHTAHEAARCFAELVVQALRQIEGFTDIEASLDLARRLAVFRPAPDFYGRIEAEHHAAAELMDTASDGETGQPDTKPDSKKNSEEKLPENRGVVKLINMMRSATGKHGEMTEFARKIADCDGTREQTILREYRRWKNGTAEPDKPDN